MKIKKCPKNRHLQVPSVVPPVSVSFAEFTTPSVSISVMSPSNKDNFPDKSGSLTYVTGALRHEIIDRRAFSIMAAVGGGIFPTFAAK